MGIVKFIPRKRLCAVCKKREATVLCDAIIGTSRFAGHPPRSHIHQHGENMFSDVPMQKNITCDLPMCGKCATKVTPYMDLCPTHYKGGARW